MTTTLTAFATDDRFYTMDMSDFQELIDGQTIANVNAIVCLPAGLSIGLGIINATGYDPSGKKPLLASVNMEVTGGVQGQTYEIIVNVSTSGGSIINGLGKLTINNE